MKAPFDEVIEICSNNLNKAVENDKQSLEFLHKFMIWLLGFSVGALYLISSNFLTFKPVLSYWVLKSIILFLTVSIASGIVHRIFLYFYQNLYNSNLFYIEGALSNKIIMTNDPEDVSNEEDVEKLINLLNFDFGIDESAILQLYNDADSVGKDFLIKALRKKYQDMGVWAVKSYKNAYDHINLVLKTGLGYNDKELASLASMNTKSIRRFRQVANIMLYVSCISFIISLLILAIAY